MLVKAKWNVKDSTGWHRAGEVFQTDADLGDAVEAMEAPKKPVEKKPEPVPEPEKEPEQKKTTSRRKGTTK